MASLVVLATLAACLPLLLGAIVVLIRLLGWVLRLETDGRRSLLGQVETKEGQGEEWDGFVGFFHPFCNAGGGGERVLWAAIRATQDRWPRAKCIVYTGDHDADKETILQRVESRFNILLDPSTLTFLYLQKRHWVLASSWPRFTLFGQSLGSVVLAWEAFGLLVPDIFIDTMGYAFALALCKILFPKVPTAAYVHYPTISTDMLESLDATSALGIHAGQGAGARGLAKKTYWKLFARLYAAVGSSVDVVMTNSTWTQAHIKALWGPWRRRKESQHPMTVLYPPVAVRQLEQEIEISPASEARRSPTLVYIAQFRPEKNHTLILNSFATLIKTQSPASLHARLVLVGTVRDDADSKRVYQLRILANELGIKDRVVFETDADWKHVLHRLGTSSVGVNGMWNEHFGIGVVEYQAAGLISVVHDSGGPKLDIVVPVDGKPTGFHATTAAEFALGYEAALSQADPLAMRRRARISAQRFTEEEFASKWQTQMSRLVALQQAQARGKRR
ncbi:hypothetical protein CDD82_3229 [Ophiocordyceps australis]|uniref:GDP-Man:Man(3)GlcNAc(2)-PP-Dol alpha-1,2-mannosyltransferase n=1 Tax=Ophiocordyceps australis TaxID=1399860 RepID=A0A2C5ZTJ4_9HYPO|nr:hypothetical protein CDD82_3229 [Ophiocordyceps australis]